MSRKPVVVKLPATNAPTLTVTDIAPRGMRYAEAANYIGATVCFVRSLVRSRAVPAIRLGKRDIILRDDLDKYLERIRRAS